MIQQQYNYGRFFLSIWSKSQWNLHIFLEQTNKANCKRMNKNKNKNKNNVQPKLFINNRRRMVKNGILLL